MDDEDERPPNHPREQGVVGTDELDISRDEHVAALDTGRYVISTGEAKPPAADAAGDESQPSDSGETTGPDTEASGEGDEDAAAPELVLPKDPKKRAVLARRLLAERVGAVRADHALVTTALVDGNVARHETVSDDVTEVVNSFLSWYADAVGNADTPRDEVLGILLLASEVRVTYPVRAVEALATANGLDRDDSIGDLLDAVEDTGASFPPRRR
ncbi:MULTISPECIES: hypothetical protein [unclassified Haloferax]|uniref:DUF7500 family protein n=1 Tax=unclassified Haloferax TaxID=2625095 RepID=UPI0002B11D3C|nr:MULTISPECIES: hypothetical protein [unclassified Haloferax]ELZ60260.1 hypothetical protein C460_05095 [Haloferax sp. ATCC BAA-646]ELZ64472.1 hypothetical protein C459_08085 [Haloferax sp. ATCC BAA-645]ELZ69693.1 hypothetical protein C458_05414 [Haloferax sp. ATCC BAA-644]